jgi:iron complex transport system substrate-binding protein
MAERIISLLASGTEIVDALGLADRLVAISHECDYPPDLMDRPRASRPRFDPAGLDSGEIDAAVRAAMAEHGSVYEIDGDLLSELAPDLVLTQAVCEVCAVPTAGVRETVRERALPAEVLSLDAHTLEDILATIRAVGEAVGVPVRAEALVASLEARLGAVEQAVRGAEPPSVLALEWLDPPFLPGHWVPEMIRLAGGACLAGATGEPSKESSWEALRDLDPDVLLVMPCGYGLEAASRDAGGHAERLLSVADRAIGSGRAFVVDASSYFNRSGPRTVDGVEILAGLLHPDRWAPPSPGTARAWSTPGAPSP